MGGRERVEGQDVAFCVLEQGDEVGVRRLDPAVDRVSEAGVAPELNHLDRRVGGPQKLEGAVGGAVVDDDRGVAGGHAPEHPRQRVALVEDGEDHVPHTRTPQPLVPRITPATLRVRSKRPITRSPRVTHQCDDLRVEAAADVLEVMPAP